MAASLRVQLVTPKGTALDAQALSITTCSEVGEMCILPGHCAILAALAPCKTSVELEDGTRREFLVDRGFLEGGAEHVRIVTESATPSEGMDETAKKAAIEAMERR